MCLVRYVIEILRAAGMVAQPNAPCAVCGKLKKEISFSAVDRSLAVQGIWEVLSM